MPRGAPCSESAREQRGGGGTRRPYSALPNEAHSTTTRSEDSSAPRPAVPAAAPLDAIGVGAPLPGAGRGEARRQDGGGGGGPCVSLPRPSRPRAGAGEAEPSPAGMCETYSRWLLRVSVAQICQALGWDSVQVSACDLLTDVLQRYLQGLGRGCHRYCELCE